MYSRVVESKRGKVENQGSRLIDRLRGFNGFWKSCFFKMERLISSLNTKSDPLRFALLTIPLPL